MMITKNDWNDALDAWVDEERERLGGPPRPEEVVAYLAGTLSPPDAERIRALLVYYPELTSLMTVRVERPSTRRLSPLHLYSVAATLAFAIATSLLVVKHRQNEEPAVYTGHYEFEHLHTRGGGSHHRALPAGQERYLFTVVPSETPDTDGDYELEIVRDSDRLWRSSAPPFDDTFIINVPGSLLRPGHYTLNLYSRGRLIDHYRFEVAER